MANADWTKKVNNNYATGFLRAILFWDFLFPQPPRKRGRPKGSKDSYKRTRRF